MPSADTPKTVVIHQPDFMPYPGFFHRLLNADVFVVLDHVQFLHNSKSWHHRDLIKTPQGSAWLTVSVKKAPQSTAIGSIEIADDVDWRRRHLNLITHHYRHAPYFEEVLPHIQNLYALQCIKLIDFNLASIYMLMSLFGINIDMVMSSDLQPQNKGCDMLVEILQKVGGAHYLSGTGARNYYRPEPFNAAGITIEWQSYEPLYYPQRYAGFIPNLSSIDMLFNCGVRSARIMLRN
jgi:hypothetical protein